MYELENGIRILLDHVTWYSLRKDPARDKWLLQFGYAGGDKTFVAYTDEDTALQALAEADRAMKEWLRG